MELQIEIAAVVVVVACTPRVYTRTRARSLQRRINFILAF